MIFFFFFLKGNEGYIFFFFFSSRRRHTRLQGDWSSDVCSSDLNVAPYGRVPPCSAIPLRIEPIACSRTPKCSVRPYGLAAHMSVDAFSGPNESAPFMVVLLD